MKTAIYIEDGVQQVVLTPETDNEKNILKSIQEHKKELNLYWGSFYKCQGGWVRQSDYKDEQNSLIIILEDKTPTK